MKPNCLFLVLFVVVLPCAVDANAQAIVQIASDGRESLFVKSDGSLWRGDRAHAQAKHNERMQRIINELRQHPKSLQALEEYRAEARHVTSANFDPVDLIVSNGVTAVAMNGQRDTFFTKADGSLWAMGNHVSGFLGDGTSDTPGHPIQIVSSGVRAVACGNAFTIFLKDDGSVWGFGWSGHGELGIDSDSVARPKQIVASEVVAIAAGYGHSLFIKRDGSLWGMGGNGYGQLGLGTNIDHTLLPVEIVASNVTSVAAARYHSLFIKSDGSLLAMGINDWGQIGDCTINWAHHPVQVVSNDVLAVTAGDSGSLFLKKDGSLWAMGINWSTDYGKGIEFHSRCPVQIVAANKAALVADYYYDAKLKSCASIWATSFNNNNQAGGSATKRKAGLQSSVVSLPGYNLITIELLKDGNVRLTYLGNAGVNYALERSSTLTKPNWLPLTTNTAPNGGLLVITNTPDPTMDNFWRIRTVP